MGVTNYLRWYEKISWAGFYIYNIINYHNIYDLFGGILNYYIKISLTGFRL